MLRRHRNVVIAVAVWLLLHWPMLAQGASDRSLQPIDEEANRNLGFELDEDIRDLAIPRPSSNGDWSVTNHSGRTWIAIRGTYDFHLATGGTKVVPWNFYLADALALGLDMGLAPGESLVLPPTVDPDGREIPYRNLAVTGLLCSDGGYAGKDGPYLDRIVTARAKARIAPLVQALKFLDDNGEVAFFEMLSGDEPFYQGSESWVVHRFLRILLLNQDRSGLKPEFSRLLRARIEQLESL